MRNGHHKDKGHEEGGERCHSKGRNHDEGGKLGGGKGHHKGRDRALAPNNHEKGWNKKGRTNALINKSFSMLWIGFCSRWVGP